MRARLRPGASAALVTEQLVARYDAFASLDVDIRNRDAVERAFADHGPIELGVHTAAQPSHAWAAQDPHVDPRGP
jgi:CDP-paratose 2-epimerase